MNRPWCVGPYCVEHARSIETVSSSTGINKRLALAAAWAIMLMCPLVVAAEDEHGSHQNHLAVFGGFTGEARRERSFSLGLDYERRISESFGVGALLERASGDRDFWVAAIPFSLHRGHWKFSVAPGIEHEEGHGDHGLIRVSAGYGIKINGLEIAPLLAVDFVEGDTVLVMGITIGMGF